MRGSGRGCTHAMMRADWCPAAVDALEIKELPDSSSDIGGTPSQQSKR
jgi:hypothetical protein